MFHFLCRNQFRSLIPGLKHIFQFVQYPYLRFISTTSESVDLTRDYLINSCGLSSETALSASQTLRLRSPENPNSVLNLFKNYGLSKIQISKIISKCPNILASNPEKGLKPKIELLQSLGISGPKLANLISSNPSMLNRGIKSLIANLEYLKSLLGTDHAVGIAVNRYAWVLNQNPENTIRPKMVILRNIGVPESNISKYLFYQPRIFGVKVERFNEIVNVVKEMKFNPQSTMFCDAVRVMVGMSKATWDRKLMIYKELGWSEKETLAMFKMQPNCMLASEKKIRRGADFFMNVLKWKPSELTSHVTFLMHSLDNRILPRYAVLQVLNSAGVLRKLPVKTSLQISEKDFLEKYVTLYEERVPDVVKAYEGKIRFTGFPEVGLLNEV